MFVGDGMGASLREAIRLAAQGLNGELAMNNKPVTGKSTAGRSSSAFLFFGK